MANNRKPRALAALDLAIARARTSRNRMGQAAVHALGTPEHKARLLAQAEEQRLHLLELERARQLFLELRELLTVIRDADSDCVADGLPRVLTDGMRARVVRVLEEAATP